MTPDKERELAELEAEAGGGPVGPMVPLARPKGLHLLDPKAGGPPMGLGGQSVNPVIDLSGNRGLAGIAKGMATDPATYTGAAAAAVPVVGPFLVPPVVAGTRMTQDLLAGRKPDWWNAGITGAISAIPGAAVQGPRLLKNLWQRTVPGSFAKAEARRLAAHEATQAAGQTAHEATQATNREAYTQAARGFQGQHEAGQAATRQTVEQRNLQAEGESLRKYTAAIERDRAAHEATQAAGREAVTKQNVAGQATEAAAGQATKQQALGLTAPKGTAKGLYQAADAAAATAPPLFNLPATTKAIGRLKAELPDAHPVRAYLDQIETGLATPAGVPLPQLSGILRELPRVRRNGAMFLFKAIATDLRGTEAGQKVLRAAQAFKVDVGREMARGLVERAGPVEAPLNVSKLAGGFATQQKALSKRVPAEEVAAMRDLIGTAQTRAPFRPTPVPKPVPFEAPPKVPFVPEPVPKATRFRAEPFTPEPFTPEPFTPGTLEGPGAATNLERLMYLLLGGGGMYYGSPQAALAAATAIPAARLVPPAFRAYRATLPPPWWRAGLGAAGANLPSVGPPE